MPKQDEQNRRSAEDVPEQAEGTTCRRAQIGQVIDVVQGRLRLTAEEFIALVRVVNKPE